DDRDHRDDHRAGAGAAVGRGVPAPAGRCPGAARLARAATPHPARCAEQAGRRRHLGEPRRLGGLARDRGVPGDAPGDERARPVPRSGTLVRGDQQRQQGV
ncbi:MAG: hypothetical protein AVDCRST_MAG88-778, partial [uncultured Thermomicrobiales bacterium]